MTEPNDALTGIVNSYNEKTIQEMEQGMRAFAKAMYAYYKGLLQAGFSERDALILVLKFQEVQIKTGMKS